MLYGSLSAEFGVGRRAMSGMSSLVTNTPFGGTLEDDGGASGLSLAVPSVVAAERFALVGVSLL